MVPQKIQITCSDGTQADAEVQNSEYFQVITFPKAVQTSSIKFTIKKVWPNSGVDRTGLCKLRVFAQEHATGFTLSTYEMFDVQNDQAVQSAKIEIVNRGSDVKNATLELTNAGKKFGTVKLDDIPANSVVTQEIWSFMSPLRAKSKTR